MGEQLYTGVVLHVVGWRPGNTGILVQSGIMIAGRMEDMDKYEVILSFPQFSQISSMNFKGNSIVSCHRGER